MSHAKSGFTPIADTLGDVLKESNHRVELRLRSAAEMGRPLTDEEIIAIAERTGVRF